MANYYAHSAGAWNTSAPKVALAAAAVIATAAVAAFVASPSTLSTYVSNGVASAPSSTHVLRNKPLSSGVKELRQFSGVKATAAPQFVNNEAEQQAQNNFWLQPVMYLSGMLSAALIAVRALNRKPRQEYEPLAMFAASGSTTRSKSQAATEYVLQMPGIIAPTGFFDPAGLSRMKTTAQLKYAREAELKHGRVAMLAALGFPFAEEFHPIFPEDTVPSDFSFQLTPLQTYWPVVVLAVGALETFSIATFKNLPDGTWELKDNHINGNLGFDPLGLKPSDPAKYDRMQNKELSNGRLAMIGIAGMVAQELVQQVDVLKADEMDIEKLEAAAGLVRSLAMF